MHLRHLSAALTLASAALAQQSPAVVSRTGDAVPGIGNIDFFYGVAANSLGETLIFAHTDSGDNNYARAILKNGAVLLKAGDPGPGVGGEVRFFGAYDINNLGDTLVHGSVWNAPGLVDGSDVIWIKGNPAMVQGDPVGFGGFNAGTTIYDVEGAILNDNMQVLIDVEVNDPVDGITDAFVIADYDLGGNLTAQTLVARQGDILAGQTQPLENVYSDEGHPSALGHMGRPLWGAVLDSGAGAQDNVLYYKNSNLIAQSGTPSVVPGRNWRDSWNFAGDTNASAQIVYRGWLDTTDTSNDEVLVLDGAIFRQKGSPAPIGGGNITTLGQGPVDLTEDGRVGYYCEFEWGDPNSDAGLFLENIVFAREGTTFTQNGQQVVDIFDFPNDYDFSDDGRFVLYTAELGDESTAVLLGERVDEIDYCDAVLHSGGGVSFMNVTDGTADTQYGHIGLGTFNLPANQFAYALCSLTQGDVLAPPGSEGRLCLGGTIGRFITQVQSSGPGGVIYTAVDHSNLPVGGGTAIQPGESWNFQTWHRDNNPGPTSNFSKAVTIEFR